MLNAILELVASDLICLLHRKDTFAEALEAEYLVQELVETYSRGLLPQVSWSRLCTDRFFHIASKRCASRMRKNRVLGLNSQGLLGAISQSWTWTVLCFYSIWAYVFLQVLDLNGHKKAGTWSEDALSKSSLSSAGTWLCGTFSRHSLAGTFLALTLSGTFQQMNCLVRARPHNKVAI